MDPRDGSLHPVLVLHHCRAFPVWGCRVGSLWCIPAFDLRHCCGASVSAHFPGVRDAGRVKITVRRHKSSFSGLRKILRNGSSDWIFVLSPGNASPGCGVRKNLRNGSSYWIFVLSPANASPGCGVRKNLRNGSSDWIFVLIPWPAAFGFRRGSRGPVKIFVADLRSRSSGRALAAGFRASGRGLRSSECGLRSSGCGLRPGSRGPVKIFVADLRSRSSKRALAAGFRSSGCGLRSSECGLRSSGCGLRSSECGLRSSECGFRPGSRGPVKILVADLRSRSSGRVLVISLRFWISDLRTAVCGQLLRDVFAGWVTGMGPRGLSTECGVRSAISGMRSEATVCGLRSISPWVPIVPRSAVSGELRCLIMCSLIKGTSPRPQASACLCGHGHLADLALSHTGKVTMAAGISSCAERCRALFFNLCTHCVMAEDAIDFPDDRASAGVMLPIT
jgi:hypothetical protein